MLVEKGTQICQSPNIATAGMSGPEINKYLQKYGPMLKKTYPVPAWVLGLMAFLIIKKK